MRTKKSLYNFFTSYIPYIVLVVLGFIKIRAFIGNLGEELFALNQLYINIFSYLSLAEAGIGVAFIYRLYKPLVDKQYKVINAMYSGTKELFKKIGIFVIIIGVVLSFGVPLLIKNNPFTNLYIQISFMLFILKNAVDYFMFVPRFVIQADQKLYKVNLLFYFYRILEVIIEIILILLGINYLIILMPGIFIKLVQNTIVNKKIFKLYPWLKETKEKDYAPKDDIKHMLAHRFVGLISNNVDIVVLSTFIGSKVVAIYAAYNYLTKYAMDTVAQIFNSMKDGLGNVLYTENKKKIKEVVDEFFITFSYFGSLIAIIFYFILDEFVSIWVGSEYIVSKLGLIMFIIILYYQITIRSITIIRTTMGLFKETKVMAMVEAIINLVLSLILVHRMGLEGVLLATIIAFILTNFWYYPFVIYKKLFNHGIMNYMLKMGANIIITICIIYTSAYLYPVMVIKPFNYELVNWFISTSVFGLFITILLSIIFIICYKEFRRVLFRGLKAVRSIKR